MKKQIALLLAISFTIAASVFTSMRSSSKMLAWTSKPSKALDRHPHCVDKLLVINDIRKPTEGIGAIAMLFKQTVLLANHLGGVPSAYDYQSVHGYMVSDILPNMQKVMCEKIPNICRLSNYVSDETYYGFTRVPNDNTEAELRQFNASIHADGCNILLADLTNDWVADGLDLLGYLVDEGVYHRDSFKRHIRINAHVRWGDTSPGSVWYEYGRTGSCNLSSTALAARQAIASGHSVELNVFTQIGQDGSLPPLEELQEFEHQAKIITDTPAKDIVDALGDCDLLMAGGSHLGILASYKSPARLVVIPDHQSYWVNTGKRFGSKYFSSSLFEENLRSWFQP